MAALLHHDDPEGFAEIVDAHPTFEQWGFPPAMATPLKEIDDYQTMDGALLRAAFEVTARLTIEDYQEVPISRLTLGRLRRAMLGHPAEPDDPEADPDGWVR